MRSPRTGFVLSAAALLLLALPPPAAAQQPTPVKEAPRRLTVTTSVEDARTAFAAALVAVQNVESADQSLRRALELDPKAGLIRAGYATFLSGLPQAERVKELDRAVADAAGVSAPELITVVALREWTRGDMPTARALARAARTLLPDDPFLAWCEAGLNLWLGDTQESARVAKAYLERNPDDPAMYNILAYALDGSGKPAEALDAVKRYVALRPARPNPHDSYAEMLQKQGRLAEAAQEYQRAVEIDPGYMHGYTGLAQVAVARHDYAAARRSLELGLQHAQSTTDRFSMLRGLAANAMFANDGKAARTYLLSAIQEAEKAGHKGSVASSHWVLAGLAATDGNAAEAEKEIGMARAEADPYNALSAQWVHAALGNATQVHNDLAELERVAVTAPLVPDALPLARLIDAAVRGDVAAARAELDRLHMPDMRLVGQGFILTAARRAGDAVTVKAAQTEIDADNQVDGSSAFVQTLVRMPR